MLKSLLVLIFMLEMVFSGRITTYAGNGIATFDGDNKYAIMAGVNNPAGVAVDASGNVFIADKENHRVRKVDVNGVITTIAGTGEFGYYDEEYGNHVNATSAVLYQPSGVAVDSFGNVYIADTNNNIIRKVDVNGTITTVAGGGIPGDNRPAVDTELIGPKGVAIDSLGNLYIAETLKHRIRKVDVNGIITTIAGTGVAGYDTNINALLSKLNNPNSVAVDSSGNLYIADTNNHRIKKLTAGFIRLIAGTGSTLYNGDNISATSANLNSPNGVVVDSFGNIYITDKGNNRVRKVDSSDFITTIAGNGTSGYSGDNNSATEAQLKSPSAVAVFSDIVFVADLDNNRIRKVTDFSCYGKNEWNTMVCSNHGECIGSNRCSCHQGYNGAQCEYAICNGVLSNSSLVCSGNGICASPDNCTCNRSYIGSNCEYSICHEVASNSSLVCSGNGICSSPNNCTCTNEYTGPNCEYPICYRIASNSSLVCSGNGICLSPNNCSCTRQNYTGLNCEYPICHEYSSNSSLVCSGNGICTLPNNCTCNNGYMGINCESAICYGISSYNSSVCSHHGECIAKDSCFCNDGYSGSQCENSVCFGIESTSSMVCSNNGICNAPNNCTCKSGYTGTNCEFSICYGVESNSSLVCSGNGICSSPNQCTCKSGHTGADCELVLCSGVASNASTVCSGNGICQAPNNCTCSNDFTGPNCEFPICYGIASNNNSVCSHHGNCSVANNCTCMSGYYGNECQDYSCFGVNYNSTSVCSGHGLCISLDTCLCDGTYTGNTCESISDVISGSTTIISSMTVLFVSLFAL